MDVVLLILFSVLIAVVEIFAFAWALGQLGVHGDFGHRTIIAAVLGGILFATQKSSKE
jgi:hypothetical protein